MSPDRRSTALLSLADAPWFTSAATRAVFEALNRDGHEVRIVGGAVRNALLGRPVKDVDFATTAMPEETMRLARAAGLGVVPTGVDHGTVTLIHDHTPMQVTTLRRDVETFGRHATVDFTTDWALDAARRDFTINALYCSADGAIHDPLAAAPDIAARRVRFIGEPEDRIREDYLRILRFFRFTAEYAEGPIDRDGLAAACALSDRLADLSADRVRSELLRLLATPRAAEIATLMQEHGILAAAVGVGGNPRALARLAEIEAGLGRPADPLLRLAALLAESPGAALALRDRLRLSSHDFDRLAQSTHPDRGFDPATPESEAQTYIYRHGPETFVDGALLSWARGEAPTDDPGRRRRTILPTRWTAPALPVRGGDIVALGVSPGPAVGHVLHAFEEWWIAARFPDDAARITDELRRLVTDALD